MIEFKRLFVLWPQSVHLKLTLKPGDRFSVAFFFLLLSYSDLFLQCFAEIGGGTDAPASLDFPVKAILKISVPFNKDDPRCTATRVAPNVLLTAAHCVQRYLDGKGFQMNGELRTYRVIETRTLINPSKKDSEHDLALVLFEANHQDLCPPPKANEDKPVIPIASSNTVIPEPGVGSFAGFGAKKIEVNDLIPGEPVENQVVVKDDRQTISFAEAHCYQEKKKIDETLAELKKRSAPIIIDTQSGGSVGYPGDSGCAFLQRDQHHQWVVTGVMSILDINHAKDPVSPYLRNYFTPVQSPDNQAFIQKNLKELEAMRIAKKVCPE